MVLFSNILKCWIFGILFLVPIYLILGKVIIDKDLSGFSWVKLDIEDTKDLLIFVVTRAVSGGFVLGLGLLCVAFINGVVNVDISSEVISTVEDEIVNLDIDSGVIGSLSSGVFLGTGSLNGEVDTEQYYYYYIKTDNKYKLEKVLAKGTELIEYDGIPKIVKNKVLMSKVYNVTNGVIGDFLRLDINVRYVASSKVTERIEIFIPNNSINSEFNTNVS